MEPVVSVMADSKAEVEAILSELCEKLGMRPMASGRAHEVPGRGGRWMARAEPCPEQVPAQQ